MKGSISKSLIIAAVLGLALLIFVLMLQGKLMRKAFEWKAEGMKNEESIER